VSLRISRLPSPISRVFHFPAFGFESHSSGFGTIESHFALDSMSLARFHARREKLKIFFRPENEFSWCPTTDFSLQNTESVWMEEEKFL
jgi:hypothetical protein